MKKRVLFVINTLGRAGAEKAMIALMNKFDLRIYDIYLYVIMGQGELVHELPDFVKLRNTKFSDESVLSPKGKRRLFKTVVRKLCSNYSIFINFFYIIRNAREMKKNGGRLMVDKLLWRAVSDGSRRLYMEFDLAIAFIEGGAAYYVRDYVAAQKKAAFIHIDYEKAGYTRDLDTNCYKDFDRIFAVSDEVRDSFLSVYSELGEKTKVFHNIIDDDTIREKSKEQVFDMNANGIRLLTVGRLTYQKGYDVAIKALKILRERGHDVYWYVLGEGPEKASLKSLAKREGVFEYFRLAGSKDNPYPYYKRADIYVHATRFEGKSIAVQEAQILGRPIVASDCSGNREQIENGKDGILCEFSPEGVADAVESLILNPELAASFAEAASKKKINHLEELEYIYELMNGRGDEVERRINYHSGIQ